VLQSRFGAAVFPPAGVSPTPSLSKDICINELPQNLLFSGSIVHTIFVMMSSDFIASIHLGQVRSWDIGIAPLSYAASPFYLSEIEGHLLKRHQMHF
jgi:hypothetical protein